MEIIRPTVQKWCVPAENEDMTKEDLENVIVDY